MDSSLSHGDGVGGGGLNAFYLYQIFAIDSSVVEAQKCCLNIYYLNLVRYTCILDIYKLQNVKGLKHMLFFSCNKPAWKISNLKFIIMEKQSNQINTLLVGRICNNFEKNRAFYDKSMKLGTWLVDNKTKKNKGQCHAENAL